MSLSVSFTVDMPYAVIVNYTAADDVESAVIVSQGEDPASRSSDPAEAGWLFEATILASYLDDDVTYEDAVARKDYRPGFGGGAAGSLPVVVAGVIDFMQKNMGETTPGMTGHTIDGDADEFAAQFGNAFDLTVGSPELVTE